MTMIDLIRRIQWARFMNRPVVLTDADATALLLKLASGDDYCARDMDAVWRIASMRIENDRPFNEYFMPPVSDWGGYDVYDPNTNTWN